MLQKKILVPIQATLKPNALVSNDFRGDASCYEGKIFLAPKAAFSLVPSNAHVKHTCFKGILWLTHHVAKVRFFVPTPLFSLVPSHILAKRMTFKRFLELTRHVAKVIVFVPKAVLSLVPSHTNVNHTSFKGFSELTSCCKGKVFLGFKSCVFIH